MESTPSGLSESDIQLSSQVARVGKEGARTGSPVLVRVSSLVKAYVPVVVRVSSQISIRVVRSESN